MAQQVKIKDYSAKILKNLQKELEIKKKDSLQLVSTNIKEGTPVITGRLRDSIVVEKNRVLTDVEYAAAVEFGTKDRNPKAMFRKGWSKSLNTVKSIFAKKVEL